MSGSSPPVFLGGKLCGEPLARIDAQLGTCDGLVIDDPLTLPVNVRIPGAVIGNLDDLIGQAVSAEYLRARVLLREFAV